MIMMIMGGQGDTMYLSCTIEENCSFMAVRSPALYIEPPELALVTKLVNRRSLSCID